MTTIRPNDTIAGGSSYNLTGGASAQACLSDDSDSSYIRKAGSSTASIILGMGTFSVSSSQRVKQVRVRCRAKTDVSDSKLNLQLGMTSFERAPGDHIPHLVSYWGPAYSLRGVNTLGEYSGPYYATAPDGGAWDQDRIDALRVQVTDYRSGTSRGYLYEVYVDVDLAAQPTASVTSPTGTITNTSLPTIAWEFTDTDGDAQAYYELKVFTAAQVADPGFDPSTSTPAWTSGEQAAADQSATVGEYLTNGTYRAYVRVAKTVNGSAFWSPWVYSEFTIDLTAPPMPSISAAWSAEEASVTCTVTGGIPTGFSSQTFEVQRSDDGGVSWSGIRNGVLAPDSSYVAVVKDYEAPRGVTVQYRARAIGVFGSEQIASEWGGERPWEVLMRQAVWYIDANVAPGGQTVPNQGTGGSVLDARLGSGTGVDTNDPKLLEYDPAEGAYIYLPGTTGNYLSAPDAAALDITGDIDIRVHIAPDSWTPSGYPYMVAKGGFGIDLAYAMFFDNGTGKIYFRTSSNGTNAIDALSTVATGFSAGSAHWVRATRDVNNGSGGNTTTFYTSEDGVTWTQLGAAVTNAGTTSIYASTAALQIGESVGSAFAGRIRRVQLLNGIGGTTVLDVDTSVLTSGSQTSFTALTGQTVTINRSTSGRKAVAVVAPVWLLGTDDYMEVADNDLLDFGASDSFTVVVCTREWASIAGNGRLIDKRQGSDLAGWGLHHISDTVLTATLDAGVSEQVYSAQALAYGALASNGMVVDRNTGTLRTFVQGVIGTGPTTLTLGSLASSAPLRVGSLGSGSFYADMEFSAAAVFRRALTADEITVVNDGYQAWANDYPSLAVPLDGRWWVKAVTAPSRNRGAVRVLAGLDEQVEEDTGVFRPKGRSTALVVSGSLYGRDGTYRVVTVGEDEWNAVYALIRHQGVLLVQDPAGGQKYIRVTGRRINTVGAVGALRREAELVYVEVDG